MIELLSIMCSFFFIYFSNAKIIAAARLLEICLNTRIVLLKSLTNPLIWVLENLQQTIFLLAYIYLYIQYILTPVGVAGSGGGGVESRLGSHGNLLESWTYLPNRVISLHTVSLAEYIPALDGKLLSYWSLSMSIVLCTAAGIYLLRRIVGQRIGQSSSTI